MVLEVLSEQAEGRDRTERDFRRRLDSARMFLNVLRPDFISRLSAQSLEHMSSVVSKLFNRLQDIIKRAMAKSLCRQSFKHSRIPSSGKFFDCGHVNDPVMQPFN
jgi:hypothetical protein